MASLSDRDFAARLVADLAPLANIDVTSGSVSFSHGPLFEEQRCLLTDLLQLNDEIPTDERSGIGFRALWSAARCGLTVDSYLAEVNRLESEYLSRSMSRFVLLTKVSIHPSVQLPRSTQEGVTLSFPATVSEAFAKGHAQVLKNGESDLHGELPRHYRWLRASVSARSDLAAAEKALSVAQYRVGLWNLALNRSKGVRWSHGRRKPVNSICLAPLHSLHKPSGQLAGQTWWYEPSYLVPLDSIRKDVPRAVTFAAAVTPRVNRLPYADEFRDWVRYYSRALSEADWGIAYIMLWQALEAATGTKSKSDDTIRRAAFLLDDPDYHRRVLRNLGECRNRLVHAQTDPTHLETRLYVLKRYVEAALVFHLSFAGKFSSLHDACIFLQLPSNEHELRERLRMVQRAVKFRRF